MVSSCRSKRCYERRLVIAWWFVAASLGLLAEGLLVARADVAGVGLGAVWGWRRLALAGFAARIGGCEVCWLYATVEYVVCGVRRNRPL